MAANNRAPVAMKKKPSKVKDDFVTTIGEGEDAVEIRLPSLTFLNTGIARRVRNLSQADAMFTVFEMHLSKNALIALDALNSDEFEELCTEWREHSGVSLGES